MAFIAAVASNSDNWESSHSVSLDVGTGSGRYVVGFVGQSADSTERITSASQITLGGSSTGVTLAGTGGTPNGQPAVTGRWFYIAVPGGTTGTQTLAVSSGSVVARRTFIIAASYDGVTGIRTSGYGSNTYNNNPTATVSSATGDTVVLAVMSTGAGLTLTPGTGSSALTGGSGGTNLSLASLSEAGASSVTIDGTYSGSQEYFSVYFSLQGASAPNAPSGVTVGSVTASSGSVSWTDNSSDETGFKVRYAPSPYSSWTTATGSVAASPYLVTGLTDGTSYKAGVAAFNGTGDSSWVESGVFTTTALSKLRPNTDTSAGSWSASSGSVLYSMIDEAVADDTDYISANSATTCKLKVETSTDPNDNSNHSIRIRARSTSGTLTVKLVQGDPAETTIVSWVPTLTSSFGDYQYDLSTAEASVITDYSALYLKLTSS